MKELEKTKRISVAAVITILIVIIALASYRRPEHRYLVNTEDVLHHLTSNNPMIQLNDLDTTTQILIDVRNVFDYERGHLFGAVNVPTPELLNKSTVFEKGKDQNKTLVLYGETPSDAVIPYVLLLQLGHENLKILSIETSYDQNTLVTSDTTVELPVADIQKYIDESVKKVEKEMKKRKTPQMRSTQVKAQPKKIIPIKKKKRMPIEGGCW